MAFRLMLVKADEPDSGEVIETWELEGFDLSRRIAQVALSTEIQEAIDRRVQAEKDIEKNKEMREERGKQGGKTSAKE